MKKLLFFCIFFILNISYSQNIDKEIHPDSIRNRLLRIDSDIPLYYNRRVYEWILFLVKDRKMYSSIVMGRYNIHNSIIEENIRLCKLPKEIKYLPAVESSYNPLAISKAGANGLWQFMPSSAKIYKLRINEFIDERHNPTLSTKAACKFLKKLYKDTGDWELALASYNCGPAKIKKLIEKYKKKEIVLSKVPIETKNYYPQLIAFVYLFNYHLIHDIHPINIDNCYYSVYHPIKIDLKKLSIFLNYDYDSLKMMNPEFNKGYIPSQYEVRIPEKKVEIYKKINISTVEYCMPIYKIRKVMKNESLWIIAKKEKISLKKLIMYNNYETKIKPGQIIFIPLE